MRASAGTCTAQLLVICVGVFAQGCAPVSLITSRGKPMPEGVARTSTYYLPKKIMEGTVTYTITYQQTHKRDDEWLGKHPNSKRRYKEMPEEARAVKMVKAADEVGLVYHVEADPDMGFWLSSSNKKGFDEFDVAYVGDGNEIIKTINSTFSPTGQEVATTAIKVVTSIIPAVASLVLSGPALVNPVGIKKKPGEPEWKKLPEDSTATLKQLVVVKKTVDVGVFASAIKSETDGACVLSFSKADLNLGEVKVPIVEVWVKRLPLSATAQAFYKEVAADYENNFVQPSSTAGALNISVPILAQVSTPNQENALMQATPVKLPVANAITRPNLNLIPSSGTKSNSTPGVLYRTPLVCDVIVKATKPDLLKDYSFSSIANRTSFPQLGVVAVAQVVYSRKRGKQSTSLEFNVDNGGLVKNKTTSEKSTGKVLEESGNMTKSLLEALVKEKDSNTELQKLKDQNSLMEEQMKKIDNQKKLDKLKEGQQ